MVLYGDTPTVEVEIEVDAAPSVVWDLITDIELPARFSEEFQGAEWIDGVTPAMGARFRGHNHHPAIGDWTVTCEVIEFELEHRFAWAVTDADNPSAIWRFDLEPAGAGTRLRQWAQMGPAPSGLTAAIEASPDAEERIVERRLGNWRSNMELTVAGIKELAEAGS